MLLMLLMLLLFAAVVVVDDDDVATKHGRDNQVYLSYHLNCVKNL